jgi:non-ribosomal peptide synthase protein (TIGR01720 family)
VLHHDNRAAVLPAPPGLSADGLRQALRRLLEQHDALRLRFVRTESGAWRQFLAEPGEDVPLSAVDLSGLPAEEQRAAVEARAAELQASLNLGAGPLRLAWFDLGGRPGALLLIVHRLAADALSMPILLGDLTELLRQVREDQLVQAAGRVPARVRPLAGAARSPALHEYARSPALDAGQPLQLPARTSSFKQWAESLHEYARSPALDAERGYWLDGRRREVARLPRDLAEGANSRASGQELSVALTEEQTRALTRSAQAPDEVLLAALAVALARWAGGPRVLIDVERPGREALGAELNLARTTGWLAALAPVLLEVAHEGEPAEALRAVREQLRAVPHQGSGYGLLRYLGADEDLRARLRQLPQAEVFFSYQGQRPRRRAGRAPGAAPPARGPLQSRQGLRRHLLEVEGGIRDGVLQLRWAYSGNVHRRETVEAVAQGLVTALGEMLAAPAAKKALSVADFPAANLSPDDFQALLSSLGEGVEALAKW